MQQPHCGDTPPAHAATIERMIAESPPFMPEATPARLVAEFAHAPHRMPAFLSLYARGADALPAVRAGLENDDWQVRKWCALFVDNFADGETLHALVPLLQDPKADVRVWAVHSLSCETCKDGPNPIDAVPLLLDRLRHDPSIRVRRQAAAMLAHHRAPDARVGRVFEWILEHDADRKLRLHARQGLDRCVEAGLHP